MRRRLALSAAAAAPLLAIAAWGAIPAAAEGSHTIVVEPGHSIQEAINDASPGDTILVEPGTYHESLLISKDDITLRAADRDDGRVVLEPKSSAPPNICSEINGAAAGICVVGKVGMKGKVLRDVDDTHISGFLVRSFPGSGIFGYGTDGLVVTDSAAYNDGDYGISRFASTHTVFSDDLAAGNGEAGFYVGDSPDADTVVSNDRAWNNGFGIFVRHAHQVAVVNNDVYDNCIGVFVLDDGQSGGAGQVAVVGNTVRHNNTICPPAEGAPPLGGSGIALVGAVHSIVVANHVGGNDAGGTVVSGGIVVASAQMFTGGSAAIDDLVIANHAHHNAPADLIYDGSGHGDKFIANDCGTSLPPGLC